MNGYERLTDGHLTFAWWFNLPGQTTSFEFKSHIFPEVPHFIGRDRECNEIIDQLNNGSTRLVSVWGSPGFGKTSVATAVGHKLDSPGQTVLFTSLRQVSTANGMAQKILATIPHRDSKSKNGTAADELKKWLSSVSDPLYLFLDNSDGMLRNKEEYFNFLREILASCRTVKLLCTTRESLGQLDLSFPIASIRIRPLDKSSSRVLVQKLVPEVGDRECDTIAQLCGNVPLAIKLACSIFSENGKLHPHWEEFSEELKSDTLRTLDMPDNPAELRLKSLFDQCLETLRRDQRETFVCLSVFDGAFNLDAAMAVLDLKRPLAAKKRLDELVARSVLDYNADDQSYTIHPLLQSFGKLIGNGEMSTLFQNAIGRFHDYYLSVLERLNGQLLDGQSSAACDTFLNEQQNISQALLEGVESHYATVVKVLSQSEMLLASIFWNDTPRFEAIYDKAIASAQKSRLASDQSRLLTSKAFAFLTLDGDTSTKLLQEALELYDPNSIADGKLQCYRGIDLIVHGETEAGMQCIQDAKSSRLGGSMAKSVATAFVAAIFGFFNDNVEEDDLMHPTQLLSPFSEFPGKALKDDQPFMLQMVHVLSKLCKKLSFPKGKARSMKTVVSLIKTQVEESLKSGEVHLNSLYNAVASLLLHLKEYDQASQCYTRILDSHYRAEPTRDTLQKAEAHLLLGFSQFQLEDYEGALLSWTKSAEMREKLLGENEDTAISYHNLGAAQFEVGDYHGALNSFNKAAEMRQKLPGKHGDTAHTYNALGRTADALGDYESAVEWHTKALAMRQKILGDEHKETADSYHALGCTQYRLTDFQGALKSQNKALAIQQKLLGEHNETADSYHALGRTQYRLTDFQGAVESHTKALAIRLKLLGEHSTKTADSYHALGRTQYQLDNYQGAVESHTKALAIRLKLLGEHSTKTANSYHVLGCTQYRLADFQAALGSFTKAVAIRQRLLGESEDLALSYHSLGCAQNQLGDHQAAVKSYTNAVKMRQKILGEHEDSRFARSNCSRALSTR